MTNKAKLDVLSKFNKNVLERKPVQFAQYLYDCILTKEGLMTKAQEKVIKVVNAITMNVKEVGPYNKLL